MSGYYATQAVISHIGWAVVLVVLVFADGPLWVGLVLFAIAVFCLAHGWAAMVALKEACKQESAAAQWRGPR